METSKGNNQGYSLAELIVVIAIMAIMAGFISVSISILIGWDARECAEEIEGHLKNVKSNALSKNGAEMRIVRDATSDKYSLEYVEYSYEDDGTGSFIEVATTSNTYNIGKETCTIICFLDDGTSLTISGAQNVSIGFNRSSGALTEVKVNDITRSGVYVTSIEITRSMKTYAVNIVPLTGKMSIEKQ